MKKVLGSLVIALGLLSGCSSVQKDLENHPEWIFSAIQKNPQKFLAVMQGLQEEQQKMAAAQQAEMENKQREEDFKNPKVAVIEADRAVKGNPNAPVQLVVYSDFQCPYCSRGFHTIQSVMAKYGNKLNYVYKHLPLPFHPLAMPAAQRYEAIAMQNPATALKFHDAIYEHQDKLSEAWMDATAKKLGVNVAKMKTDLKSKTVADRIEADKAEAAKFGFAGTPGYLVGGVAVRGAYPQSEFEKIIDALLAKKGASGEPGKSH